MDLTAAQLLALVCHLNARIRGLGAVPLLGVHPTMESCASIRFLRQVERHGDAPAEDPIAATPEEWMRDLVGAHARRALACSTPHRAGHLPDHLLAAFVGGGTWSLWVEMPDHAARYLPRWEEAVRTADDDPPWRVAYVQVAGEASAPAPSDPGRAAEDLRTCLAAIEAYARAQRLSDFAGCFARAQACLAAGGPFAPQDRIDLAPPGVLPLASERLLAASRHAWVFGGMGSWNDVGLEGDETYDRLSAQLFTLLTQGMCAAANASAPR